MNELLWGLVVVVLVLTFIDPVVLIGAVLVIATVGAAWAGFHELLDRAKQDDAHATAGAAGRLGYVEYLRGRSEAAIERMERALATVSKDEPDEDLAILAAQLARVHMMMGNFDAADGPSELALDQQMTLPSMSAIVTTVLSNEAWMHATPLGTIRFSFFFVPFFFG